MWQIIIAIYIIYDIYAFLFEFMIFYKTSRFKSQSNHSNTLVEMIKNNFQVSLD